MDIIIYILSLEINKSLARKQMNIKTLNIIDFNNQIATKKGHHLYHFDIEELSNKGFIAYAYRDEEEEKGLKAVYGETKQKAINKFNQ